MAPRALVGLALLMAATGQTQTRAAWANVGAIPGPKPNILILLDTSGSMAGVAGAPYGPSSEVGMDCEFGANGRLGGVTSACLGSRRPCLSSQDCRSGFCSADNRSLCAQDSDCPQGLGHCSQSGGSCLGDADCPQAKCRADRPTGTCGRDHRTCEADSDCLTSMRCQQSGDLCRLDGDCPLFQTTVCGGGSRVARACSADADCPGSRCLPSPANPCIGTPNPCHHPCPANLCEMAMPNTCQRPASTSDTCAPAASGTPGPLRMCQGSQRICRQDADCGEDDACGPATSRAMLVKRALAKLVLDHHDLANFGLMTFFQNGYFPYGTTDASANETATEFLTQAQLRRLGCYSWDPRTGMGGPSAVCDLDGRPALLRPTADSRYRVSGRALAEIETDFCGESCELPHQRGLGGYLGSSYLVRRTISSAVSAALVRERYEGHDIVVGGQSYAYFTPRNDYSHAGPPLPIGVAACGDSCSPSCGAGWDARLVPFMDTSDNPEKAWAAASAISARLEDAAHGGLVSLGGTPIGCALDNDTSPTPFSSAYHYMSAVKQGVRHPELAVVPDPVTCRRNFVWLLTDGLPNGPGDVDDAGHSLCAAPACAAEDPKAAGCRCRSVLAAARLHRELGVTVLVFGFSVDAGQPEAAAANHNVAKAGGSGHATLLVRPRELEQALADALGRALGTGVVAAWAQASVSGKRMVSTRTELPGWQGQVSAFAMTDQPHLLWDARANLSAPGAWRQRRVYTWTGSKLLRIQVDHASGAILNRDELAAAGLGTDPDEAGRVARWVMEDPAMLLGANLPARPVEMVPPVDSSLPGGHAHFLRHAKRPSFVFVGASDQMLHAFLAEDAKLGGETRPAGSEAFAFIPPDLLPRLRQLYLQGGQRLHPAQQVLGLAGTPQVLELCTAGCSDDKTATWRTLLVASEGPGGRHAFALDVSDPLGTKDPPFTVVWHTAYGTAGRAQAQTSNDSVAAPAHLFNPTPALDEHLLVSASGLGVSSQQKPSVNAWRACDGSVAWSRPLSPKIRCAQEYTVAGGVVVARAGEHDEQTVAGYFGDSAGQLWRVTPGGELGVVADFGCDHPLHISPTLVQHVGAPGTLAADRDIFLVQVTNANRAETAAGWPASHMVFLKHVVDLDKQGRVLGSHPETRWGQGGRLALVVGGREMCGQTHKSSAGAICDLALPGHARPTGQPVAWATARGFRVATLWTVAATSPCEPGRTFLTVHQVEADKATQLLGTQLKSRALAASPVVMAGRLFVWDGSGRFEPIAID